MKSDQPGVPSDGVQESGDVGEAEEDLGTACDGGIIHPVQQANSSIAAPDAPDCIDGRLLERPVQIGESLVIAAAEVTIPTVGIGT
jgi:hypothetical protein